MKVWDRRWGRSKRPFLHYFGVICDGDARKVHARALAARRQRGDATCPVSAFYKRGSELLEPFKTRCLVISNPTEIYHQQSVHCGRGTCDLLHRGHSGRVLGAPHSIDEETPSITR